MERLTDCAQGSCEMYCKKYMLCFEDPEDCTFKDEIKLYDAIKSIEGIVPFERLLELACADKAGRLVKLPFVAMVEQSLQDGKMKPMGDQKHNGRYAVVYVDRNKWKSPLIDICGKPYDRAEAEARMAVLAQKGGESDA